MGKEDNALPASQLGEALRSMFSPDQLKVMYRGNYTIKQAGLYLGVGETRIRELIDSGKLGYNKIGSGISISKAECDRLLKDSTRYKSKSWRG